MNVNVFFPYSFSKLVALGDHSIGFIGEVNKDMFVDGKFYINGEHIIFRVDNSETKLTKIEKDNLVWMMDVFTKNNPDLPDELLNMIRLIKNHITDNELVEEIQQVKFQYAQFQMGESVKFEEFYVFVSNNRDAYTLVDRFERYPEFFQHPIGYTPLKKAFGYGIDLV